MHRITFTSLQKTIKKFPTAHILVVGDIIMDKYIWGRVTRISPEAPVPIVNVNKETFCWGGAANVANNVECLGGQVSLSGVIGRDRVGEHLLDELHRKNIDCSAIIKSTRRPTTLKTRIIAHSQQVVRVDYEVKDELQPATTTRLISKLNAIIPQAQAVVISDYAKGVVGPDLIQEIINMAHRVKIPVVVDPQVTHFQHYKKVSVITPNHHEASRMSRIQITDEASLIEAGQHLLNLLDCEAVLITRGEEGMTLFEGTEYCHIPTMAQEVYDVTGAGDTVTGVFALALAVGSSYKEAALLANHAAGVVVAEVGTASLRPNELIEAVQRSFS